jgi:hypothetical protein
VGLLGVLLLRELRRLGALTASPFTVRSLTLVAIPLAVGLVAVIIERFLVLA